MPALWSVYENKSWIEIMQSEQIDLLAAALVKAQAAMKPASMNKINPHFKSKYADLASVIESVRKPLTDNGLAFTQTISFYGEADGSVSGTLLHTTILHTSGQWLRSDYPLPANATPQQMGAALTYARRYSLSGITGTAADDDLDGEGTSDLTAQTKKKPLPEPTYSDGKKIAPHEISMPDKPRASDWIEFGELLITAVSGAENDAEARAWKAINRSRLEVMSEKDFPYPKIAQRLEQALLTMGPKNAP